MLEWGPYLKLLERRRKRGKPVPALDNEPELFEDLQPAWRAFNALHKQRQVSFVPPPLTVTDISTWLEINNYQGIEKQEMYEMIIILDSCWVAHMRKRLERDEKSKKGKRKDKRKKWFER